MLSTGSLDAAPAGAAGGISSAFADAEVVLAVEASVLALTAGSLGTDRAWDRHRKLPGIR
jgi:hypothetical protein